MKKTKEKKYNIIEKHHSVLMFKNKVQTGNQSVQEGA